MFCSKCGQQMPDGSNFCPSCGQKVAGYAMPSNNNNTTFPTQGNFANSYNNYGYNSNNITFTTGTLVWLWICIIANAFIIIANIQPIFDNFLPAVKFIHSTHIIGLILIVDIVIFFILLHYILYCIFTISYFMLVTSKDKKHLKSINTVAIFNALILFLALLISICVANGEYSFFLNFLPVAAGLLFVSTLVNPFYGLLNILITNAIMKKYWSNNFSSQTFVNNAPPSPQTKATDERWLCPHCNEMNPSSSLICRECGKVRKSADKWTCSHCNTPNPNSSLFCKGCGKIKE